MTTELLNSNVRELAERSCIDSAHILFTTLNSAGHPSMESTEFCVTVVDEAAQVKVVSAYCVCVSLLWEYYLIVTHCLSVDRSSHHLEPLYIFCLCRHHSFLLLFIIECGALGVDRITSRVPSVHYGGRPATAHRHSLLSCLPRGSL